MPAAKASNVVFQAPAWKIRRLAELRAQVAESISPSAAKWSRFGSAGELAKALDPATVQTPALDLVDAALVQVAEGTIDRLIISMPPQEGKSERVSHYGALWMLHQDATRRIALISHDQENAARISSFMRNDLMTFTGEEGTIDLGIRLRPNSKAASRWNLDGARGGMYAIGIGGSLTGRPVDVMIIDDPVKDYRAADSHLRSEQAWEWWMSVGQTRLAPGSPVILVQTRWHEQDLAGRFLAKQAEDEAAGLEHYDRWTVINIPAQADHRPEQGETDPLDRQPGEYMVSARGRKFEDWERRKNATASRIWTAMYQGKPAPVEGELFKRAYWQRYEHPKAIRADDGSMHVPGADEVIQSWDMAFKDRNSSDFVVGQVWARFGTEAWLVHQVRGRWSFTETCNQLVALSHEWPQATAKLVEDKANGTAVIDQLKSTISGLIPINPGSDSKYVRALAVTPYVEAHQIHIPAETVASWAGDFVEEAAMFPNTAHDDQVDAMTQALTRLLGRNHGPALVVSPVGWQGSGSAHLGGLRGPR